MAAKKKSVARPKKMGMSPKQESSFITTFVALFFILSVMYLWFAYYYYAR